MMLYILGEHLDELSEPFREELRQLCSCSARDLLRGLGALASVDKAGSIDLKNPPLWFDQMSRMRVVRFAKCRIPADVKLMDWMMSDMHDDWMYMYRGPSIPYLDEEENDDDD